MGIGTSSSSRRGARAPMRIAYAVNPDARLSWGDLPAPGRGLSSVRPDACHLICVRPSLPKARPARHGRAFWTPVLLASYLLDNRGERFDDGVEGAHECGWLGAVRF